MNAAQFLFTRFNSRIEYAPGDLGINNSWLAHRFNLFETFCLPSVLAQTQKDFFWILDVDERTPATWLARLEHGLAPLGERAIVMRTPRYEESLFRDMTRKLAERQSA